MSAPFGLSTHIFHGDRLARAHLELAHAHGLDLIELFATRTHVDYHDPRHLDEIGGWLAELDMTAASMHAPITVGLTNGEWGRAYSNASPVAAQRQEAVDETLVAIAAARRLKCETLVLHLGLPRGQRIPAGV